MRLNRPTISPIPGEGRQQGGSAVNEDEPDLAWQETVDLSPEDEVEGGSETCYFTASTSPRILKGYQVQFPRFNFSRSRSCRRSLLQCAGGSESKRSVLIEREPRDEALLYLPGHRRTSLMSEQPKANSRTARIFCQNTSDACLR